MLNSVDSYIFLSSHLPTVTKLLSRRGAHSRIFLQDYTFVTVNSITWCMFVFFECFQLNYAFWLNEN